MTSSADAIIRSLYDHPDQWESTKYELTHKTKPVQLWIANGRLGLVNECVNDYTRRFLKVRLGLWDKFRVWKAYTDWLTAALSESLEEDIATALEDEEEEEPPFYAENLEGAFITFTKAMKMLHMDDREIKRNVAEGELRAFREEDGSMKFKYDDVQRYVLQMGEPPLKKD